MYGFFDAPLVVSWWYTRNMSKELIAAIADRHIRGISKEVIYTEVQAAGYTHEQFESAYTAATTTVPDRTSDLIGYSALLSLMWRVMRSESSVFLKTVLLGVAAFVGISTGIFLLSNTVGISSQESFFLTAAIVPLVGFLIGFVASLTLMRAIIKRQEGLLFRQHLRAVASQFVPVMLVTVYLTILTQVGYAFFVIPGIMATVYFLFATPLTVAGEARGFSALTASTALVYGRFWQTFGRFLVVNLVILAIALGILLLGGVSFASLMAMGVLTDYFIVPFIIVGVLVLCVAAFYATTCGLVVLFESLKSVPSPYPLENAANLETLYKVIVGIVVVLLAIVAFLVGFAGYALVNW